MLAKLANYFVHLTLRHLVVFSADSLIPSMQHLQPTSGSDIFDLLSSKIVSGESIFLLQYGLKSDEFVTLYNS